MICGYVFIQFCFYLNVLFIYQTDLFTFDELSLMVDNNVFIIHMFNIKRPLVSELYVTENPTEKLVIIN